MNTQTVKDLQNTSFAELMNAYLQKIPTENPLEYFDKMYSSINPVAIMEAVKEAKVLVKAESDKNKKCQNKANVYLTLGSESMNQSFFTGMISALLWLPKYIQEVHEKFNISKDSVNTCLSVLHKSCLPEAHDVKEEVIKGEKIKVEPSNVRHYSAFMTSILGWLNSGVSDFQVKGVMKSNLEHARYLSATALQMFPAVPFASYYIGTARTDDMFGFSKKIGKSFDFRKYMSEEAYAINQPQFVTTTDNAPIVSIVGHPLAESFVAEVKDDGEPKWLGLFVETEEFSKLCAKSGYTVNQIKEYIIQNTMDSHLKNVAANNALAMFIENQKLTKEIFKLRQKFGSVDSSLADKYDL